MERLLKKLEFIRNTLREEFKTLSKKELNGILTFVYEEQIRN